MLSLQPNGLRLRFDGPNQRLRLIEVLNFTHITLIYKGSELVRRSRSGEDVPDREINGPPFRHIYNRLFGPTYPGEYIPPLLGHQTGTYVLSYPGLAFNFPFRHKSWSDKSDFVALLSSSAASSASGMAVFSGASWPEARGDLYVKAPTFPRSLLLAGRHPDNFADEIEEVIVLPSGVLQFSRRNSSAFILTLNETTPQDLVAELGPPDAVYRKHDSRIAIHRETGRPGSQASNMAALPQFSSKEAPGSTGNDIAEDSETEEASESAVDHPSVDADCFYNYFYHGFDVLISSPTARSPNLSNKVGEDRSKLSGLRTTVTKVLLHSNVPGSFSFNRHRRSRWKIALDTSENTAVLTSEMPFIQVSSTLKEAWKTSYANPEEAKSMQRGMVLNRGWGESPESSIELLGGFEEQQSTEIERDAKSYCLPSLSNTELFGFPGMLFEVLKNDAISCLTVY